MSGDEDEVEVSRWYTHTRKFPQLVGKTHNGTAIWGGPYTYAQIIVFVAIVWVGTKTYDLWGRSDIITNALMLVGVAYGVAVLVGKLPIGMRSPVSVLLGMAGLQQPRHRPLRRSAHQAEPPPPGHRRHPNHPDRRHPDRHPPG